MRARAVVAIVLLLLPAGLSAQRIPTRAGGRGPGRGEPLPPQPPAVARELAYKRLRVSLESYPIISYVDAPGYFGGSGHWSSFGAGTRADYRVTRFVAATLDLTSSLLGGPAMTQTAELGTRIHRERTESRAYPFADVRFGYMSTSPAYFQAGSDLLLPGGPGNGGFKYSQGFGGVVGGGMEYALTRRFSLTTAGSVMRSRMRGDAGPNSRPGLESFTLTLYRATIGLRYNPVRMIIPSGL
jgi:hypothetical protein